QAQQAQAEQDGGQGKTVFERDHLACSLFFIAATAAGNCRSARPMCQAATTAASSSMEASSTASRYGPYRVTPTALADTSSPLIPPSEGCPSNTTSNSTSRMAASSDGPSQAFGVSHFFSCACVAGPRLS